MKGIATFLLVTGALLELARFDVIHALWGFAGIQGQLVRQPVKSSTTSTGCEAAVRDAIVLASCFYWKPVRCLQRSACAARMLRARGVRAHLVIGYRPTPFFSHAWVEVAGRVVNDSPEYAKRLQILHTI